MGSRVCFVTIRNIFNTSCLPKYRSLLDGDFDIIYWDQHGIEESAGARNQYRFAFPIEYGKKGLKKALGYLKFRSFASRIIKENQYEVLILLPTQTAFLFKDLLLREYKGRYIIDIRDYFRENNPLFYKIEAKLIKNSGLTVITSPAYKKFLPDHDFLISHNLPNIDQKLIEEYRRSRIWERKKIVISCIGSIRFIDQFEKVILKFAGDDRFELRFIGRGSEQLEDFCKSKGARNVVLKGRFENKDTVNYYMDTNIILNLYGNGSPFLDYALSNKLYYAASFGMPILVCAGTYMEEVAVGGGFGFTYNLDDKEMNSKLYTYYKSIDHKAFFDYCDAFIEKVNREEEFFMRSTRRFLSDSLTCWRR